MQNKSANIFRNPLYIEKLPCNNLKKLLLIYKAVDLRCSGYSILNVVV